METIDGANADDPPARTVDAFGLGWGAILKADGVEPTPILRVIFSEDPDDRLDLIVDRALMTALWKTMKELMCTDDAPGIG